MRLLRLNDDKIPQIQNLSVFHEGGRLETLPLQYEGKINSIF